jgi:hypothetical protein
MPPTPNAPTATGLPLSFIEQELVNFALAIILSTIKNPAHAAALRTQLLTVADAIDGAYGLVPPAHT